MDNVQVLGTAADVQQRLLSVSQSFRSLGIPFTLAKEAPTLELEMWGLVCDLKEGLLRNKSRRVWQVWLATLALLRRRRIHPHIRRSYGACLVT